MKERYRNSLTKAERLYLNQSCSRRSIKGKYFYTEKKKRDINEQKENRMEKNSVARKLYKNIQIALVL
jgi:hypothetical protein